MGTIVIEETEVGGFYEMFKQMIRPVMLLLALSLVAGACSDDAADDAAPATTAPATTAAATTAAPAATTAVEDPTELKIAMIIVSVKEEPWYATYIDAIGRVTDAKPHGLDITLDIFEGVDYADGERIIRDLAASSKYGIILAHSTYSDSVAAVRDEFPDILFSYSGSGNEPLGGNAYWVDVFIHEPSYLAGIIAGMMTETNKISGVFPFPYPNVNAPMNAYIAGARSVNPDIEATATYIESWFDPMTARESAAAQIAAGSDMIYMDSFGSLEAVEEADGVYAFGHYSDQHSFNPDLVLASSIALWDPAFMTLVNAWWAYKTEDTPYDGPMERILFYMPGGGSGLGVISDSVPSDVLAIVEETREKIMSGELVLEINEAAFEG